MIFAFFFFLSRTVESVIDRRYRQDKAFAP